MYKIPTWKLILHYVGTVFKTIFWICFVIGTIGASIFVFYIFSVVNTTQSLKIENVKSPEISSIYDANNVKIMDLGGAIQFEDATYDELPEALIDAVVATEDRRFFEHDGYDAAGTLKAAASNALGGDASSGRGGSTITQQLIKNTQQTRLTVDPTKVYPKTFAGQTEKVQDIAEYKVPEMVLANQLEQKMSKEEIIAAYLNTNTYYGQVIGIKAAAKYYFNKNLNELTVPECAFLAGVPQAPAYYNPYYPWATDSKDPKDKIDNVGTPYANYPQERYEAVIVSMYDAGYVSNETYQALKETQLSSLMVNGVEAQTSTLGAYVTSALDEAKTKLGIGINDPIPLGTKIYTNVRPDVQALGNQLSDTNEIVNYEQILGANAAKYNMSYTVVENKTGKVVAMNAGRGANQTLGGFNIAVQGSKQPGSSIKPLIDYAPAVEKFKWSTAKQFNDTKMTFLYSNSVINNYDNSYKGVMTMTQALADSRNVPAVEAFREANRENTETSHYSGDFLEKLGITLEEGKQNIYEPYAIGGFTHGVSTLEMANAYTSFPNMGVRVHSNIVNKITDSEGEVVYEFNSGVEQTRVMHEETASIVQHSLASNTMGSGLSHTDVGSYLPGYVVAGKTGTTDLNGLPKDQWYCGFTANYSIAIWAAFDDQTPVQFSYAIDITGKIFRTLVEKLEQPNQQFTYSANTTESGGNRFWSEGNFDGGVLGPNGQGGGQSTNTGGQQNSNSTGESGGQQNTTSNSPSTSTPSTSTPSTSTPSPSTPSTSTPSTSTPSTSTPSTSTPSTSTPSTSTPSTITPSPSTPSTITPSPSTPSTSTP